MQGRETKRPLSWRRPGSQLLRTLSERDRPQTLTTALAHKTISPTAPSLICSFSALAPGLPPLPLCGQLAAIPVTPYSFQPLIRFHIPARTIRCYICVVNGNDVSGLTAHRIARLPVGAPQTRAIVRAIISSTGWRATYAELFAMEIRSCRLSR